MESLSGRSKLSGVFDNLIECEIGCFDDFVSEFLCFFIDRRKVGIQNRTEDCLNDILRRSVHTEH